MKIQKIIVLFLAVGALFGAQSGGRTAIHAFAAIPARPQHPTDEELRKMAEQDAKLSEFYRIMARNYLDTMSYEAIVERGIKSMLGELDPHSIYLTANELKASKEELGGGFSGIGIEFDTLADTIIVVNTIVGGPAAGVGMLPGDRIVSIDNQSAIGIPRGEVPRYLRGPKGTKVAVKVFRRRESDGTGLLDFTITRDDIPINTVEAAYKPDQTTGYIKVNRFGATTGREFSEAFTELNRAGKIDGLILDLRGNGGGFLPEAIKMSENFLKRGQKIVSTEGNMYPSQTAVTQQDGVFSEGLLIVLVDELSASASEIVAGAVQDWDRGIVIGNTTFGKGLVQREFALGDGSAVRLTIAKYLTPTGRAIQRPYERGHSEEYYRDAIRYSLSEASGSEVSGDTLYNARARFKTLISGRTVYGGGGITPDIVMPTDSASYSTYWSQLVRSGRMREFVQGYIDGKRAELTTQYADIEDFIANFDPTAEQLADSLADAAAQSGMERDEQGLETSRRWIEAQLKALIAQQLWGTTGYYQVIHPTIDQTFKQALAAINNWRNITTQTEKNRKLRASKEPKPGSTNPITDELVNLLRQ